MRSACQKQDCARPCDCANKLSHDYGSPPRSDLLIGTAGRAVRSSNRGTGSNERQRLRNSVKHVNERHGAKRKRRFWPKPERPVLGERMQFRTFRFEAPPFSGIRHAGSFAIARNETSRGHRRSREQEQITMQMRRRFDAPHLGLVEPTPEARYVHVRRPPGKARRSRDRRACPGFADSIDDGNSHQTSVLPHFQRRTKVHRPLWIVFLPPPRPVWRTHASTRTAAAPSAILQSRINGQRWVGPRRVAHPPFFAQR
jgi:hypothetical protein